MNAEDKRKIIGVIDIHIQAKTSIIIDRNIYSKICSIFTRDHKEHFLSRVVAIDSREINTEQGRINNLVHTKNLLEKLNQEIKDVLVEVDRQLLNVVVDNKCEEIKGAMKRHLKTIRGAKKDA